MVLVVSSSAAGTARRSEINLMSERAATIHDVIPLPSYRAVSTRTAISLSSPNRASDIYAIWKVASSATTCFGVQPPLPIYWRFSLSLGEGLVGGDPKFLSHLQAIPGHV